MLYIGQLSYEQDRVDGLTSIRIARLLSQSCSTRIPFHKTRNQVSHSLESKGFSSPNLQTKKWRPGRDLDPDQVTNAVLWCPAGDSRIYYSDVDAVFVNATGLYYQGYLFGPGAEMDR